MPGAEEPPAAAGADMIGSDDTLMDCANTAIARQNQPAAIAPLRKCFILFSLPGLFVQAARTCIVDARRAWNPRFGES